MTLNIDFTDQDIDKLAHTWCANFVAEQTDRFEVHSGDPSEFGPNATMAWHYSFLDMQFYQAALIKTGYRVCSLYDAASLDAADVSAWVTLSDKPISVKDGRR